MNKKTHEKFVQQVSELFKDEYKVISKYDGHYKHVTVVHNLCNREWTVLPSNLLRGATCLHCYRDSKFKTHDQFVNDFYSLVGNDDFILLGEYKGITKRIKIKHNIPECGHEFNALPNALLTLGGRCRKCADRNQIKTQTEFITEVYDLVGNEYTVLGEYTGASDHISMKHNICGNEYLIMPKSFTSDGRRCPLCSFHAQKTTERFKREVFEMVGDEYDVLSEYERSNIKVKIFHRDCENEYWVVPNSFYSGSRCPYCFASKGETKIRDILKTNKINFIKQYRIPDCKNKNPLPFDFAILDESNKLKYLVEYDGISHFQEVEHFGGSEGFKYRQQNDQIKDKYCIDNNINLIRIPYYDYENIETILDNILKSA